jgi:hypothetical protein
MAAGQSVVTYQRKDRAPFRVDLVLPDGEPLCVWAGLLTLDSFSQARPDVAPPTTLDLHVYPSTLEEGRDELLSAARRFGLDATTTQSWYQSAREPSPGAEQRSVSTGWLRATITYVNLQYGESGDPRSATTRQRQ